MKHWLVALVLLFVFGCGESPRGSVICNYAGSPYLDPGIPDECEQGQLPQP